LHVDDLVPYRTFVVTNGARGANGSLTRVLRAIERQLLTLVTRLRAGQLPPEHVQPRVVQLRNRQHRVLPGRITTLMCLRTFCTHKYIALLTKVIGRVILRTILAQYFRRTFSDFDKIY